MPDRQLPKGLATLALLKTRFDSGQDHLELFEPFAEDVLPTFSDDGFTAADCKQRIHDLHGLDIPVDAVSTVLGRIVRRGLLRREAGRYWVAQSHGRSSTLEAQKKACEAAFAELGRRFREFCAEQNETFGSPDDALAVLVTFIVANDVVLLLDELPDPLSVDRGVLSHKRSRLAALFIRDVCLPNTEFAGTLERLARGIVLQNALLLRNVSELGQRLSGVTVYFDTGFLFGLVGAKGEAAALAAKECVGLLAATGATIAVFDRTVDEMRRILEVYERHLGTADGRLTLHATPLTHHFLSVRATPSDVRQLAALLETKIRGSGIVIRPIPPRTAALTMDEVALARELASRNPAGSEQRIQHDIDCIASILTFRGGEEPSTLERCHAIFATTSGTVVRTVNEWFRSEGGRGLSPIINQLALSNIAWLKKPAAATSLKVHELAALCDVALQPPRNVWVAFKRNLTKLRNSGEISTDEAVAVVAHEMTATLLTELADEAEPDADSYLEVVERVKASYRAEADKVIARNQQESSEQMAALARRAESAEARHGRLTTHLDSGTSRVARVLAQAIFYFGVALVLTAAALGLPGVFDAVPSGIRITAWIVVIVAVAYGVWTAVTGGSLRSIRDDLTGWLFTRLRGVTMAPEEHDQSSPGRDGNSGSPMRVDPPA